MEMSEQRHMYVRKGLLLCLFFYNSKSCRMCISPLRVRGAVAKHEYSTQDDSDVAVIRGHIQSLCCGASVTAYCVKLSGEDLSRYSNKTELVGLRKCPYYHILLRK